MSVSSPWKAIARSVIGYNHLAQQLPCQDYSEYRLLTPDILVGAVADGAGSAKLAELGAVLAVKTALDYVEKWHRFYQRHGSSVGNPPLQFQVIAEPFFQKLVHRVQRQLKEQAQTLQVPIQTLATTLLVFIASPSGIVAMQIGDGFLVIRSEDSDYQSVFHPDKGEYINETSFITSNHALETLQVRVIEQPIAFICAATDGLEKVAIRYRDWTAFSPFFQPLEMFLAETEEPEANANYLEDFLHSERLNQKTQDDKTLLLGLFEIAQAKSSTIEKEERRCHDVTTQSKG